MQITEQRYYTPEEYLELEEAAEYKSEYINGEIIPMAGGTTNHNRLALNLSTGLNFAFRQQDYEVFMGDVRLWIPDKHIYTYPDVMVIAGKPEYYNNRTDTVTNPIVIAGILSKSTQNRDRQTKFEDYKTIPSFQEYILIDQTKINVMQYVKTGRKRWEIREHDIEDEVIALHSILFQLSLEDLYNKVDFEAKQVEETNLDS
ncbi:Uma2 family endonuclease [Scytonema millei]|uniref:Uma2 family endonuclease n=1 Tax=Scytonema millei VB511283 TaxID=1245923 RepID=A0A9X5E5X3_9CYAN|nr:Uma2 family endonuclease [Scytonema millei]NHC34617.1 Uma2 family endonuclease [Scytonema millei VB511283]